MKNFAGTGDNESAKIELQEVGIDTYCYPDSINWI